MDKIKYKHRWNEIDERFNKWFNGNEWEKQVKFLSEEMRESFNLSKNQVNAIFERFHEIYREERTIDFDWKIYQLPTLIAITSNVVKFKK